MEMRGPPPKGAQFRQYRGHSHVGRYRLTQATKCQFNAIASPFEPSQEAGSTPMRRPSGSAQGNMPAESRQLDRATHALFGLAK